MSTPKHANVTNCKTSFHDDQREMYIRNGTNIEQCKNARTNTIYNNSAMRFEIHNQLKPKHI